jgi:hypothetical protein
MATEYHLNYLFNTDVKFTRAPFGISGLDKVFCLYNSQPFIVRLTTGAEGEVSPAFPAHSTPNRG